MSDELKIFELYMEMAAEQEQPQMTVYKNGSKAWRLHGKLHRDDGPAIEFASGSREWYIHDRPHREDGPAIEYANGYRAWYLHGELHREDGPAVESASGARAWWLHGKHYATAEAWAQAVLEMRNKPHDAEAVQKYVRMILTKDDLI